MLDHFPKFSVHLSDPAFVVITAVRIPASRTPSSRCSRTSNPFSCRSKDKFMIDQHLQFRITFIINYIHTIYHPNRCGFQSGGMMLHLACRLDERQRIMMTFFTHERTLKVSRQLHRQHLHFYCRPPASVLVIKARTFILGFIMRL